jgi:hypothetical protein
MDNQTALEISKSNYLIAVNAINQPKQVVLSPGLGLFKIRTIPLGG